MILVFIKCLICNPIISDASKLTGLQENEIKKLVAIGYRNEYEHPVRLLLVFFVFLIFLACSRKNGEGQMGGGAEGNVVGPDALVYDEIAERCYLVSESTPYSGKVHWYYDHGQLEQETRYLDGREHGTTIWWNEDGSRAGQSFYVNGLLSGPLVQWFEGGVAKELQIIYRNGLKEGQEVWWYKGGQERSVTTYQSGKREGVAQGWFEDGSKSWEATWMEDVPQGEHREWYPSGQLKSVVSYREGKLDGIEVRHFDYGQKSYEVTWDQGLMQGLLREWYEGGEKLSETPYKEGLRQGVGKGWYENGNKAFEVIYHLGGEVALQEWDEAGNVIPPPPVAPGRIRPWLTGDIEKYYAKQTRDTVYSAFGEPDESGKEAWRYEEILVGGRNCSVQFLFKNEINKSPI